MEHFEFGNKLNTNEIMYLFNELEYVLKNSHQFPDEETTFSLLKLEGNSLGIVIDRRITDKIFKIIQLYKKIDEIYNNAEFFLKAFGQSLLENFQEPIHKEFYDLYFELNKILRKRTSVINSINLPSDITSIIIKYDYYFEGKEQLILEDHDGIITCIAVLPDGRIVSGSSDKTLKVWDLNTEDCFILGSHDGVVNCVAVLPDGRVVSGSSDKTLKVWDLNTKDHFTLESHTENVNCVAVLPDGRIVSGSSDKTLKVWDLNTKDHFTLESHTENVNCVAVLPDGRVVSGSLDKILCVWDLNTKDHFTLEFHAGNVNCIAALSDGRVVSGSCDGTLQVWNPDTKENLLILKKNEDTNNKKIFAVYDFNTRKCLFTFGDCSNCISRIAILPNEWIVASAGDTTLQVWDSNTGEHLFTLKGHANDISCVSVLLDGRIISGSLDETLRVWK